MHQALSIREILDAILSQCSLNTLEGLARTSRHFHQPCIVAIWKHADRRHLHRFDLMFWAPFNRPNSTISTTDVWSRVEFYCSLFRSLSMPLHYEDHPRASGLFARMTLLRPHNKLFPRLQCLDFQASRANELSSLILFVESPLKKLNIKLGLEEFLPIDDEDDETLDVQEFECHMVVATFLYRLKTVAPVLQEFTFFGLPGSRHSKGFLDALSSFLKTATALKKFGSDCYTLTSDTLPAIAALGELTEWVVGSGPFRDVPVHDPNGQADEEFGICLAAYLITEESFPSLRNFNFSGSPVVATSLLQALPSILNTITFSFTTFDKEKRLSPRVFSQLADAMQARADPTSLHLTLIISEHDDMDNDDDEDELGWAPFTFDLLLPILDCRSVNSFELDYRSLFHLDLTDAHLTAMGEAWSQLESLVVHWSVETNHAVTATGLAYKTELTLGGVASLAARSKLSKLSLSEVGTATVPLPSSQSASVKQLGFGDELVRNVEKVARYIHDTFPNARLVDDYCVPTRDRGHGTWTRVLDELQKLRTCEETDMLDEPLEAFRERNTAESAESAESDD